MADKNNHLVVKMEASSTYVMSPGKDDSQCKQYLFDYSYWSHDGYETRASDSYLIADNSEYVDQAKVYQDLGVPMLENAMKGYNASIFAYGQTGSGKSYSIMGNGSNKGIVPRICENLFKLLSTKNDTNIEYEVTFSMVEIYQEKVKDLLSKVGNPKEGLQVKEDPKKGFYVHNMKEVAVVSEQDVSLRIQEGDKRRSIAATAMNETSSRAHTIVSLVITQKFKKENETKIAKVNLVDLAGSERQSKTHSTGDRFDEATKINLGLTCLGKIILSLSSKNLVASYRESKLTMLLKNAIGGNSKTVMLAAISPSSDNYDEIISTLEYAKRAKVIKNTAVVNATRTDKMIKDLLKEKERLLKELDDAKINKQMGYNEEEIRKLKEEQKQEIDRYKNEMKGMEQVWQKKLEEAKLELKKLSEEKKRENEEKKKNPHFWNLNEDPALTGKITHLAKPGESTVGNGRSSKVEVLIHGHRITDQHATITNTAGAVSIVPLHGQVRVNGREIKAATKLQHQDRVIFGDTNVFVFHDPVVEANNVKSSKPQRVVTYEMSQKEVAECCGIDLHADDARLEHAILSILQKVQDANAMAIEMDRAVQYDICLIAGVARGDTGGTELKVRMCDEVSGCEHMLDRNDFINRYSVMREIYLEYEENDSEWNITDKEKDPFWEPTDRPYFIGVAYVPLTNLSHLLDLKLDCFDVYDYMANQVGDVQVTIVPCGPAGDESADLYISHPDDMMGKDVAFVVKIDKVIGLSPRFIEVWCQYRLFRDTEYTQTPHRVGPNLSMNHSSRHQFSHVNHEFVDYLSKEDLAIEIWGIQDGTQNLAKLKPESAGSVSKPLRDLQSQLDKAKAENDALLTSMKKISSCLSDARPSPTEKLDEIRKIVDAQLNPRE